MRVAVTASSLLLWSCRSVHGLLQQDAGKSDFLVATAGHGAGVDRAAFAGDVLVTTGGRRLAGRNVTDGTLLWRRDASARGGRPAAVDGADAMTVTVDAGGVLRGWSHDRGGLLFDAVLPLPWTTTRSHRDDDDVRLRVLGPVLGISSATGDHGDVLSLRSSTDGESVLQDEPYYVEAERMLTLAKVKKTTKGDNATAKVVAFHRNNDDTVVALVAWAYHAKDGRFVTSVSNMAIVQFSKVATVTESSASSLSSSSEQYYEMAKVYGLKGSQHQSASLLLSSLQLFTNDVLHNHLALVGIMAEEDGDGSSLLYATGLETVTAISSQIVPTTLRQVSSVKVLNESLVAVTSEQSEQQQQTRVLTLDYNHNSDSDSDNDTKNHGNDADADFVAVDVCGKTTFAITQSQSEENGDDVSLIVLGAAGAGEDDAISLSLNEIVTPSVHGDVSQLYVRCSTSTANNSGDLNNGNNNHYNNNNHVAFITTARGTSVMVTFTASSSSPSTIVSSWVQEESLASVADVVLLDSSSLHLPPNPDHEENSDRHRLDLSFSARLRSQWDSAQRFVSEFSPLDLLDLFSDSTSESRHKRDVKFGFAKVAVLLSDTTGRLFGLDTLRRQGSKTSSDTNNNNNNANMVWSLLLNPAAVHHRLVHGGTSSRTGAEHNNNNNGGTMNTNKNNELLVLSTLQDGSIEYKCVDGVRGHVYGSGVLTSDSNVKVVQIVPVRTSTHGKEQGGCKQLAMLLFDDGSVRVIPDHNKHARSVVNDLAKTGSRNGLYTHTIDRKGGRFASYRIRAGGDEDTGPGPTSELLAETVFQGEEILQVAYPQRGEVVTSPATILGDDSLLLKYTNPHLVVVVTHSDNTKKKDDGTTTVDPFVSGLNAERSGSVSPGGDAKKKPLGVTTKPNEDNSNNDQNTPNLFVNLVDGVSSKILYRISHAHASPDHPVPVTVSENWIVYTYYNTQSKRADIGVLTLHEGMIDKYGITAFHTQVEQELEFSSFTAEKPIVLHKVYTLGQPKGVDAIGVTRTARGISSKHFVFALGSQQVLSVDRRWLDPRRPSGEPKASEKVEGLQRYTPILPFVPQQTPSYFQTVEGVTAISTSAANVESHSLILTHGGPDIFFTRLSPSKGFDMLPDTFNKGVLSVVVLALLGVLLILQRLNTKAAVIAAWG